MKERRAMLHLVSKLGHVKKLSHTSELLVAEEIHGYEDSDRRRVFARTRAMILKLFVGPGR